MSARTSVTAHQSTRRLRGTDWLCQDITLQCLLQLWCYSAYPRLASRPTQTTGLSFRSVSGINGSDCLLSFRLQA